MSIRRKNSVVDYLRTTKLKASFIDVDKTLTFLDVNKGEGEVVSFPQSATGVFGGSQLTVLTIFYQKQIKLLRILKSILLVQ